MNRRNFLQQFFAVPLVGSTFDFQDDKKYPVDKTAAEWKRMLTPEQFFITRQKGTEQAFSGKYWNNHEKGLYRCVCCRAEVFRSDAQLFSGSGWPTFSRVSQPRHIEETDDTSYGMVRKEVTCSQCGAHLGYLSLDGPAPGKRKYTINSASLLFENK